MVAGTICKENDFLGKDFSSLEAKGSIDLDVVAMTSMKQDIALKVEWMAAIDHWDNGIVEEIDYTCYSKN